MRISTAVVGDRGRDIYSVSRLNLEARSTLEGNFPLLWVEGELSNLVSAASGHRYFSLKDSRAQIRCVMFKSRSLTARPRLEDGMQVLVRARLTLYEPRGDFQLNIEHLEEVGDGTLLREFERLKQTLRDEGLFDEAHKRPLPAYPKRIGVLTSAQGAAVHDVLTTLARRWPVAGVVVIPVPVQGAKAASTIVDTLRRVQQLPGWDLFILARGGGSLEDLWAFNDEALVRALFDCPVPIVTGIGHDLDFTLADFVADGRGATPTAAAQLATPDVASVRGQLLAWQTRLSREMHHRLRRDAQRIDAVVVRLRVPSQMLGRLIERVGRLTGRLRQTIHATIGFRVHRVELLRVGLTGLSPDNRLRTMAERLRATRRRLQVATANSQRTSNLRLQTLAGRLHTLSPLATLHRGYAVLRNGRDEVITRVRQTQPGERILCLVSDGSLDCRVVESDLGSPAWLYSTIPKAR